VRVTAGASVQITGTTISSNLVHGANAPVGTVLAPTPNNDPFTLGNHAENNQNLRLGSGVRLVGAAASSVTQSNVTDNAFGVLNTTLNGLANNTATPIAAQNDYWAVFDGHLQATSAALEKVPLTGEALAAAFDAAVAPVRAFHDVVEAFVARGRELQAFSAELSAAGALADVRSTLADIHEAQELGPELARMTDAQSRLSDELRELLLPVKKFLVENLAAAMEILVEMARSIRVGVAESKESLAILIELLNDIFGSGKMADVPDLILRIDGRLKRAAEDALNRDMHADALGILEQISQGLDLPGAPKNPAAGAKDTGLEIPGLRGGF